MVSQHKYIFMSLVNLICGGILEVNSVVRRTEKRTKKILLPEWSSGGVKLYSSFYLRCRECFQKNFFMKKSWLLMNVQAKFLISAAVIVLGRRFSVARTEHILRLEKRWYLLLHNICCPQEISIFTFKGACVDTGMFILSWLYCILYSLTHCFLVL